jgi:hypothetical protein
LLGRCSFAAFDSGICDIIRQKLSDEHGWLCGKPAKVQATIGGALLESLPAFAIAAFVISI